MSPEPWPRIERYFHELADLPKTDQRRALEQRFGDRPELRRRLEALLACDGNPVPFLDQPVATVATAVGGNGDANGNGLAGRIVGRYRLLQPIAYGGMGTVYLARPDSGDTQQPVAVKLLREVIEPGSLMKRYRAERQALAQLDHPNIARLLDAGMTEHGTPYLVMEYVDGLPIDAYCDHHRLPLRERLELFRTVCLAVHAAHRSLVIHRDLKPDNILVTEQGAPKLVDFGLARLLDQDGAPSRLPTTGGRLMTPQYASPEQVRGEPVTTATDVYSLGVVLFGLLTGDRPYRLDGASPAEVEQLVCLQVPRRPSTVVAEDGNERREAATNRKLGTDGLSRRLRGDLDNIVMMALRKEPQRRYTSAAELAEDVRRYLAGRPVAARQDTVWYRTGKFIMRNKVSTGIAAVLALSLVCGAATIGWQAHLAIRQREAAEAARAQEQLQRDRAEAAEHQARTEAESARLVSNFLVDIFNVADPADASAENVTVRQVLDEASTRLNRDPMLAPEAKATLALAVGRVSLNLGLYDRAEPLLTEAERIRGEVFGDTAAQTLEARAVVGELHYAQGEYDEARGVFENLVAARRRGGEPDLELAQALNDLGATRKALGDLDGAESLYGEALGIRRELAGDDDAAVAESLNNLAGVHASRGEMDQAQTLLTEALRVRRAALGDDHPLTAQTISNLATVARLRGDAATAEPLYREALDRFRGIYGDEHPAVATTASELGALLQARGDLVEAEKYLREAVDLRRRELGDDHPALAISLARLARVRQDAGDLAEARALLEEALRIQRVALPAGHAKTASTLQAYGSLLLAAGEPGHAETALREAVAICRDALPAGHYFTAITEQSLAAALVAQDRCAEAEPLLLEAYESLDRQRGEQDADTRRVAADLAAVYERTARPDEAAAWHARE